MKITLVRLSELECVSPHGMMCTPPELIDDRAASDVYLGQIDGIVPQAVNELGPRGDSRDITDKDADQKRKPDGI